MSVMWHTTLKVMSCLQHELELLSFTQILPKHAHPRNFPLTQILHIYYLDFQVTSIVITKWYTQLAEFFNKILFFITVGFPLVIFSSTLTIVR